MALTRPSYDIITVGGGIAAATLAKAMAEQGAKVLVLEREEAFKDRVRGEYLSPWGVAEARELAILDVLKSSCAHEVRFVEMGMGPRDLAATTPQQLPALAFAHQEMQEILLAAAQSAGAEVRRGVTAERIAPGSPAVVVIGGTRPERIGARLVVAADGRNSACRKWAGFQVARQILGSLMAGVLLTNVPSSPDLAYIIFNPELGSFVGSTHIGRNRVRAYFGYPKTLGYRLNGEPMLNLLRAESAKAFGPVADLYANAQCIGPLASFDVSESWVEHPYLDGVALTGDAAGTSDPLFGQGLALALRGVRVLRDELSRNSDWSIAGDRYAEQHCRYFADCRTVEGWFRTVFQDPSPKADLIRKRAMPLLTEDPTRVPDHLFSGPDLPVNEGVRARFFGEC